MTEYINKAEILKEICCKEPDAECTQIYCDNAHARDRIQEAETINIVKCKDCKYQIRGKCYAGNIMEHRAKVQVAEHVKDDWFCADGEEKNNENSTL